MNVMTLTRPYRIILICAILLSVTVVRPEPVWASCQCAAGKYPSPEAAFAEFEAVSAGTVTKVSDPRQQPGYKLAKLYNQYAPAPLMLGTEHLSGQVVRFQVKTSWKGIDEDQMIVVMPDMCRYPFEAGQVYLVYAEWIDGRWHTNACPRTNALDQAVEDLAYLESVPPLTLTAASGNPIAAYSLPPVLMLILVLGGVWIVYRKWSLRQAD